jgi:hypothetical protein
MKYTIIVFFLAISLFSTGQPNGGVPSAGPALKRGLYQSYEEYLNNAPSVTAPFNASYYIKSKKDSTVIGATYSYKASDGIPAERHIWGFCDGKDVFFKYSSSVVKIVNHFWKLECLGPHPCFSYSEKDIEAFGPPVVALTAFVITGTVPALYEPMMINEKGKAVDCTIARLKKWLAPQPDLLAAFTKAAAPYVAAEAPNSEEPEYPKAHAERIQLIKDYLLKLNERMALKSQQP